MTTTDGIKHWLLQGLQRPANRHSEENVHPTHAWWKVMCLTGVDYFSTLGYQPGIAALAAGALSPVATILLVALTLFGALPVYRTVAGESPNGLGSLSMLEGLLPGWRGKLLVLFLLGFVATAFIVTITLSAADASTHLLHNPFIPDVFEGWQIPLTLVLIAALGAIFLIGFSEAISIAVVLVGVYLALNLVVMVSALQHVLTHPDLVTSWRQVLTTEHSSPLAMIAVSLLVMPKLALGLSGFETGVAVMPLVKGDLTQRIRGARLLLTTAACIMSVFLIVSSFVTTVLIPEKEFEEGGKASGRALAYLAHEELGEWFGTAYDLSTVAILWFAGASAMAGLLNIVPRYLPRYGMAPDWSRAARPMILVFTAVAFLITLFFKAQVEAQGGAYATGVLALILSAAVAVTLLSIKRGNTRASIFFGIVMLLFAYAFVDNIIERPDGLMITMVFVLAIVTVSLISRATRSTELRALDVTFDETALKMICDVHGQIRFIANEPDERDLKEYEDKAEEAWQLHRRRPSKNLMFLEITVPDASEFETELMVRGEERHGFRILKVESPSIPNAIAAVLLKIRDETGNIPHVYFHWAEGNPIGALLKYLVFGGGDIPPLTREILRKAEPDPERRPTVHVG